MESKIEKIIQNVPNCLQSKFEQLLEMLSWMSSRKSTRGCQIISMCWSSKAKLYCGEPNHIENNKCRHFEVWMFCTSYVNLLGQLWRGERGRRVVVICKHPNTFQNTITKGHSTITLISHHYMLYQQRRQPKCCRC